MFCKAIAKCIVKTLCIMKSHDSGPGGFGRGEVAHVRNDCFGSRHEGSNIDSVSLLNEDSTCGRQVIIDEHQSAIYLHVDDGVFLSDAAADRVHSDKLIPFISNKLEEAGFLVPDRTSNDDLTKVVGYEPERHPAGLRLPGKKAVLLRQALIDCTADLFVDCDLLRCLLGVWTFGALLRRDLLCIPHAVYKFIDMFEGQCVRWWSTARAEVRAMALAVPFMKADLGNKIAPILFATDAMDANSYECGALVLLLPLLILPFYMISLAAGNTLVSLFPGLTAP
jgi:hypothetical protein